MKKIYDLSSQVKQLLFSPDFIKFIVSGVLSVILEFYILIALVEKIGLTILISNSIAFIITNIFNYILSRIWVFGKSHRRIRHEILLFFATAAVGLTMNQIIMKVFVDSYHIHYKIVKLIAILIVVVWNFLTKKFLVFSTQQKLQNA